MPARSFLPLRRGIAQETIQVGEIDAARVVIAPPQTELARIIKSGLLEPTIARRPRTRRAYAEAQKLYFFYGARHFEPLWLTEDADGKVAFSASAPKDHRRLQAPPSARASARPTT